MLVSIFLLETLRLDIFKKFLKGRRAGKTFNNLGLPSQKNL